MVETVTAAKIQLLFQFSRSSCAAMQKEGRGRAGSGGAGRGGAKSFLSAARPLGLRKSARRMRRNAKVWEEPGQGVGRGVRGSCDEKHREGFGRDEPGLEGICF